MGTTRLRSWRVPIIRAIFIFRKRSCATVSISPAWTGNVIKAIEREWISDADEHESRL